jgi:TonB family protein
MDVQPPYITKYRRRREQVYRTRIGYAIAAAVLFHLSLFAWLAPFSERLPLVRHIGYQGVLRILPEISVRRRTAEVETDLETSRGLGSEGIFQVVSIEMVDWAVPAGTPAEEITGEVEQESGDDLRNLLEESLPQPTSSDVVVLRVVKPTYPAASIIDGVEGVVVFRLHLSETGDVVRAWLLSSEVDEACEESAHHAVLQWKFRPFLVNGEPTSILVDQRVRFRLHDPPEVAPGRLRIGGDRNGGPR